MYELGRYSYLCKAWNVTGGAIELSIEKAGYSDGVVLFDTGCSKCKTIIQKDLEEIYKWREGIRPDFLLSSPC
jgi:hypothetical protein